MLLSSGSVNDLAAPLQLLDGVSVVLSFDMAPLQLPDGVSSFDTGDDLFDSTTGDACGLVQLVMLSALSPLDADKWKR